MFWKFGALYKMPLIDVRLLVGYTSEVLDIHIKLKFYGKITFMDKICEENISTCWSAVIWVLENGSEQTIPHKFNIRASPVGTNRQYGTFVEWFWGSVDLSVTFISKYLAHY